MQRRQYTMASIQIFHDPTRSSEFRYFHTLYFLFIVFKLGIFLAYSRLWFSKQDICSHVSQLVSFPSHKGCEWGFPRYGTVIVNSPHSTLHTHTHTQHTQIFLSTLIFFGPHSFFSSILTLSIHTQRFPF